MNPVIFVPEKMHFRLARKRRHVDFQIISVKARGRVEQKARSHHRACWRRMRGREGDDAGQNVDVDVRYGDFGSSDCYANAARDRLQYVALVRCER